MHDRCQIGRVGRTHLHDPLVEALEVHALLGLLELLRVLRRLVCGFPLGGERESVIPRGGRACRQARREEHILVVQAPALKVCLAVPWPSSYFDLEVVRDGDGGPVPVPRDVDDGHHVVGHHLSGQAGGRQGRRSAVDSMVWVGGSRSLQIPVNPEASRQTNDDNRTISSVSLNFAR